MTASTSSVLPPTRSVVELRANGEISRMRSHKGNMPSLPQTKYCSLCPAKFTRTTHLNRHLRSHTNERLHRCNTCHAEFTRSDLLTRHKRTCGDSRNANRSRRKSCQACAESKVKCNLHYPCSKCISRGKECIFINDPEISRNKRNAAKKAAQQAVDGNMTNLDSSPIPPNAPIHFPVVNSSLYPECGIDNSPRLSPNFFPTSQTLSSISLDLPGLSGSSTASTASSRSSPRSELFETRGDFAQAFDIATFDTLTLDSQHDRLFPSRSYKHFPLEQAVSPTSSPSVASSEFATWLDSTESTSRQYEPANANSFAQGSGLSGGQTFTTNYSPPSPPLALDAQLSQPPSFSASSHCLRSPPESATLVSASEPTTEDLEHYLYLFFSAFNTQIPLIHPSTWKPEGKPTVLIRAMQACGALFVKTRTAMDFINKTLAGTRDALIIEFSNSGCDLVQQIHLLEAIVLLQTIGLFHQSEEQRVSSNMYHGMLVMIIRRIGLINRVATWVPPDLTNLNNLEQAWKDWALYESVKRTLLVSYLHDCCHCMYFSISPSFQPSELVINLPCDQDLWTSGSAPEWLQTVRRPSPYGVGLTRLTGFGMQRALGVLGDTQSSAGSLTLNPFAHFILIHTILRNLYASNSQPRTEKNFDVNIQQHGHGGDASLTTQYVLHKWLQTWMRCPDAVQYENSREEPPFVFNVLPFYWLAQASLMSLQEDVKTDFPPSLAQKNDGRYSLMKDWLDRIKYHLRRGSPIPNQLWDEMMKRHLQFQQRGNQRNVDRYGGLTAFFPAI